MKIKLLADYRGVLTDEAYYTAGEYEAGKEMPEGHAQALISAGRAEEVKKARRASRTKTTRRKTTKK